MLIANTAQIREADRIQIEDHHFPGILLMEEAGRLTTEALWAAYPDRRCFLVLAGPGNNGGDGLVIARHLHLAGFEVRIWLSHALDRYQGDAAINARLLAPFDIPVYPFDSAHAPDPREGFSSPPVLIDALLGTGINARLRGSIAELLTHLQSLPLADWDMPVVAIDLPSGLNADTGAALNQVLMASYTFTFQLPKICHYIYPAADYCGEVQVLDIGLWPQVIRQLGIQRQILNDTFLQTHYRTRLRNSHKGTYGHVLVVGGSYNMAGAPSLSAYAALKAGAGLVSVMCPGACRMAIFAQHPELMCLGVGDAQTPHLSPAHVEAFVKLLAGKTTLILGPGLGTHPDTADFLRQILPLIECCLLLDADGLNLWESIGKPSLPSETVLTPHPGEMRRLLGGESVQNRRLEVAEAFAQEQGHTLVLKGAGTLIASPEGQTYVNTTGNPGLASAGTGDVLSGVIGALLAQGYEPSIAAAMGVYLHGKAADLVAEQLGQERLTASLLVEHLPFPMP